MFWSAKQALKRLLERSGYTIRSSKALSHGHHRVYPQATYAPWSVDQDFMAAYDQIRFHTLVDKYRCWELWKLVEQTARLPTGDYIEVGVWRGGSGCLIAKKVRCLNLSSQVFLCDTFTGVVKAGQSDNGYKGGEHADTGEGVVHNLASKLGVDVQIRKGMFPEDTGTELGDRSFRFCHIDVDVYQSARDSTEWFWPRLVSRGVIVYDDYGFQGCDGVRKFLDEWQLATDCTFMHNLNGHAVIVKP
jgi:O-methyltransferase